MFDVFRPSISKPLPGLTCGYIDKSFDSRYEGLLDRIPKGQIPCGVIIKALATGNEQKIGMNQELDIKLVSNCALISSSASPSNLETKIVNRQKCKNFLRTDGRTIGIVDRKCKHHF